jgi:hypothetical protein
MPSSAQGPAGLYERRRRRDALADLADGLARHLAQPDVPGDRAAWTQWSLRLAAGLTSDPAPDGTRWLVRTIEELV